MIYSLPPPPKQAANVEIFFRWITIGAIWLLGHIHQVRSYKGNRTISATMLFTASLDDTFDNSSCDNETYEYRALSQANVHWTYNKGDKTIDMGYQNVERFRQTLLSAFEEIKVSKCWRLSRLSPSCTVFKSGMKKCLSEEWIFDVNFFLF